jgi:hypothetical protein
VAIRGGLSGDLLFLPFSSAGTAGSTSSYFNLAPLLGVELGYCETHWGVSIAFDGAPFGLIPGSAFSAPPMHYVLAVNLNYLPDQSLRWIFGVEPFNLYYADLANGGSATIHGVGLRAGLHFRLSDPGSSTWEAFGILSAGVMRETDLVDASGNSTALDFTSPGVAGSFTGYFTGVAGVQWTFSL